TMGRMDTTKLAKVMNIMEPSRSARLTELLAGVARARRIVPPITPAVNTTSNDVANPSAKGGERDNGQNQQQQQQQYNRSSGSGERIPSSIRGTIAAPSAGKGKGTQ
ncbi:MAG: hypothetical protein ACXWPM_02795, partial [Bdellovibrionota bacterium]